MKKFLSVLLAALMLLSVLAGCRDPEGSSSTDSTPDEIVTERAPFVLATSINSLFEGGDMAGEECPFRCVDEIGVFSGSSYGKGDNKCIRATGTGYAIFKKSNVPAGKYALKFWLKDNGNAQAVYLNLYVNGQSYGVFNGNGNNKWTEYSSGLVDVPENATISIRLDVEAGEPKLGEEPKPIVVDFDEATCERLSYDYPEIYAGNNPVSYFEKLDEKTYVTNVAGERVIIKSAYANNLSVAPIVDSGLNAFAYTFSAADDLVHLETAIKTAEENNLYMQIFYNLKGADENSAEDLAADKEALTALMKKLTERDTNKKVISINISNKFAADRYKGNGFNEIAAVKYLDELAKIVKESGHAMITSVSMPNNISTHYIYNTEYIDFNCSEITTSDAETALNLVNTGYSRIKGAATAPATVATGVMFSAYADGGFAPAATVNADIKSANAKISNIEHLLVNLGSANKASFNTDAYNAKYVGSKKVGEAYAKFEAYVDNGPVGIAVYKDKAIYAVADKMSFFSAFGVDAVGVNGSFDKEGVFGLSEKTVTVQDALDGSYRVDYTNCDVLKFTYYLPTEPEASSTPLEPLYDVYYLEPRDIEIAVNLLPANGGFEDGVNFFTTKKTRSPGQVNFVGNNESNQAIGKCGLNLYCGGDARDIHISYELGVLPVGTYGIMARAFGGNSAELTENPDKAKVVVIANGEEISKMTFNGDGKGWIQYIDKFTLKSKAKTQFEVRIAMENGGCWIFMDGFEFVRIA